MGLAVDVDVYSDANLMALRFVEMSVTKNSSFQNYSHLDDNSIRATVGSNHLLCYIHLDDREND